LEIGAGLILLAAPSVAIGLLLSFPASEGAAALGRLAGAALLSLGASCWWARDAGGAGAKALVRGMLIYNAIVAALVASSSLGPPGAILWAVAALHGAMAFMCAASLRTS
jgi:hypothetical protein